MTTAVIVLGVLFLPILLLGGYAVLTYNTLVRLENRYENAYSQIDVQLKRRHDLIPNLVETVTGYLDHERETLEAVMEAQGTGCDSLFALRPLGRGDECRGS